LATAILCKVQSALPLLDRLYVVLGGGLTRDPPDDLSKQAVRKNHRGLLKVLVELTRKKEARAEKSKK